MREGTGGEARKEKWHLSLLRLWVKGRKNPTKLGSCPPHRVLVPCNAKEQKARKRKG
jgi:hypothetical protein